MKMKTLFRHTLLGLCLLSFQPLAPAQVVAAFTEAKSPPQLLETAPAMGTFYLLGRIPSVPYPFDPYRGARPVYAYDGVFFVDDTAVSWLAEEFSLASFASEGEGEGEGGGMMMALSGPGAPGNFGGGGGNLVCAGLTNFFVNYQFATNGLTLGIAQTTNPWIALTIRTATTNQSYDVFGTTNLLDSTTGLNRTNWVWLARLTGGTTNFSWGLTNWCERYFQLGTLVDDDLDGLTTAYEILVSHTKWAAGDGWDSDGDGLSDDFELRHSHTDPNNPDTGNTGTSDGYKDPDGDGWTHLDEMRNGTNPLGFNTPAAPPNVTVHFVHQGTNATISWEPANGPVTGYIIRNGSEIVATVSSNTFEFVDYALDPTTGNAIYAQRDNYTVQAVYENGSSEFSDALNVWNPTLAIHASVARGQSNQWYVLLGNLHEKVSALLLTWYQYENHQIVSYQASVSLSNIVNHAYAIPEGSIPTNTLFYVQGMTDLGELGPPGPVGSVSTLNNPLFYDIRRTLSDNLRFFLRGATRTQPFNYAAYPSEFSSPTLVHPASPGTHEFSGFHKTVYYEYPEAVVPVTYLDPNRPLAENFLCRNYAYDFSLFQTNGFFLTGAHPRFWDYGGSRSTTNAMFAYNGTSKASQLAPSQTGNIQYTFVFGATNQQNSEWLSEVGVTAYRNSQTFCSWTLSSGATNFWGLPVGSVRLVRNRGWNVQADFYQITPGQSANVSSSGVNIFPNVAPPNFQTVDYLFSIPTEVEIEPELYAQLHDPRIPSEPDFSVTNTTPLLMAGVGQSYSLSGWAKKIITNGDTNKPAYLEQFFDKALKADANGNATTNETGLLSEFGEFFPTEPGRVVLTTKPDIETSEVGQALVNVISLNVDANHDGTMDRTFSGPDATSAERPFRFWINNDSDGGQLGAESLGGVPDNSNNQITSVRDLEDFARLWISGVPAISSYDGYEVSLSWQNYSGSPAIRIFQSLENDGGNLYLTDTNVAWSYVQSQSPFAIGTVTVGTSVTMPFNYFAQSGRKHFVFEGVGAGKGELVLTISRSGTVLAKTSTHLELKDIRDFYERGFLTGLQQQHPAMRDSTNASVFGVEQKLAPAPDETKQLVVYVHGFNNGYGQFRSYAETFFKRLYWQGYRGRFAALKWPTHTGLLPPSNYNESEYIAFRSAQGAAAYLTDLRSRFPDHSINVAAHSMGNIVMMEALKLHLAAGRQDINNYVLMEAAVPAQCYDANVAAHTPLTDAEQGYATPNTYQLYPGNIQNALRGPMANFFNEDDFALGSWLFNQVHFKPSDNYSIDNNGNPIFIRAPFQVEFVTESRELMAFVARPRTKAAGAQVSVGGVITGVEVDLNDEFGFDDTIPDHSGQFTRNIQKLTSLYRQLGVSLGVIEPEIP